MKVVVTPRAEADIVHQHAWGEQRFGANVAVRTFARVAKFREHDLPAFPKAIGRYIPERDLYESTVTNRPSIPSFFCIG